jgi:hypothetical protein
MGIEQRVRCQRYTRIVGYWRPIRDANKGKQQEISERKMYDVFEGERIGAMKEAPVVNPQ